MGTPLGGYAAAAHHEEHDMTQQGDREPDHTEGDGATIEESIENVTEGSRSDGVLVPPEDARSGESPVEQAADDDATG